MEKYIKTNKYICRTILDKILLFPLGESLGGFQGGILLNNVSYYIWNLLSEEQTKQSIIYAVSNEFNVDVEFISNDIDELIEQFIEMKIIKVVNI